MSSQLPKWDCGPPLDNSSEVTPMVVGPNLVAPTWGDRSLPQENYLRSRDYSYIVEYQKVIIVPSHFVIIELFFSWSHQSQWFKI